MSAGRWPNLFAGLRRRRRLARIRVVFLHIPKTAGQSVRQVLARHTSVLSNTKQDWLGWEDDYTHRRWAEKGYACFVRDALGEEVWECAFKFSFVRNPWARAVSAWRYLDRPGDLGFGLTFPEFLARIENLTPRYAPDDRARNKFSWHVEPQAPQLLDATGRVLVDFVGRTERLDVDFAEACRRAGIAAAPLPRVNATEHSRYQEYYDASSRERVGRIYAQDVETFGYAFED